MSLNHHPAGMADKISRVSILGCGWYGLALAKKLVAAGYAVKGSSTSTEKLPLLAAENIEPYLISFGADTESYDPDFFNTDLLLISIPPKRSSGEQDIFYKKISRIIAATKSHPLRQVVFISSTAVYGDHNCEVTENSLTQPDTDSGKAMLKSEDFIRQQQSFTSTIIRFAGLVGPGRNPGRFFAGKDNIANGQAPVNLVHLDDCIGFTLQLIQKGIFGYVYNICSPDHPSRQDFYVQAALSSGLSSPSFRNELEKWKIVSSIQSPSVMDYQYQVNNWLKWLQKDN